MHYILYFVHLEGWDLHGPYDSAKDALSAVQQGDVIVTSKWKLVKEIPIKAVEEE